MLMYLVTVLVTFVVLVGLVAFHMLFVAKPPRMDNRKRDPEFKPPTLDDVLFR